MSTLLPLRVGKIPYANLAPFFHALETRCSLEGIRIVPGHPAALNRMLREGTIDLSPSSSIEYGLHPERYLLCPGLSVSSRERVMSVVLLSHEPPASLPAEPIAVTGRSDTSVVLLEILLRESLGKRNRLIRTDLSPREALRRYPAYLAIGDEAIRSSLDGTARRVTDLGAWWHRETGLPFAFALWIVTRKAAAERAGRVRAFAGTLLEAKAHALEAIRHPGAPSFGPAWIPPEFLREYWRHLSYDLDRELEGLSLFYRLAHRIGRIPRVPPIAFLDPAPGPPVVQSGRSDGRGAMRIHKDMKIEEVLRSFPQTIAVFQRFGIDCAECQLSKYENVEHGARVHRIDLETLLAGLNESVEAG
ncbi:MAG: hypothetical protein Kow00128_08370 [Deltaproteobacteria bacterium]